jgi:hypothetical protein
MQSQEEIAKSLGINIVDSPEQFIESSPESVDSVQTEEQTSVQDESIEETQTQDNVQAVQSNSVEPQEAEMVTSESHVSNEAVQQEPDLTDEEIEDFVLSFLSERLGRSVQDFDSLMSNQTAQSEIDERVAVINEFVQKTGRSPQEWFTYQSLNPSEMDDLSAVKTQFLLEMPNLTEKEVEVLINSKYRLDEDRYDENDVMYSKVQLKVDAERARKDINSLRDSYAAPIARESKEEEVQPLFDNEWMNAMYNEVDSIEALEFEIAKDKGFAFGLTPEYKKVLKQKNGNLENYFDQYIDRSGNWNYELLSSHQTLIDNIDVIAKSIYQQGLSDGQKQVVESASNVSVNSPNPQSGVDNVDKVREQILNALQSDNMLRFKI